MEQPRGFGFRMGRIAVRRRRLERLLREYCELCRREGRFSPHDRLAIATARGMYWDSVSYAVEASIGRFDACERLTRGQLEGASKLLGAALHGNRDHYAQHLRGGHPLNQLREAGPGGKSLDPGHLLARLDRLARQISGDLPSSGEVYGNMSGYVHLSPDLLELFNYGNLEDEEPEAEFYPVGPPGGVADDKAWLGSARRFEGCTRLFAAIFAECLAHRGNRRD